MKRRAWWTPWTARRLPLALDTRPFPVEPLLRTPRRHGDDPWAISRVEILRFLGCPNGEGFRLLAEGLTIDQADRVAVDMLGKHPSEIWPVEWDAAAEADRIVDELIERERRRTFRFVSDYLRIAA